MTGAIPTLGYPTRQDAIVALHEQGKTPTEIAEAVGSTRGSVSVLLHRARRARRTANRRPVLVGVETLDALSAEAVVRNLTVPELVNLLLKEVVAGNLVDAVLDDGVDA